MGLGPLHLVQQELHRLDRVELREQPADQYTYQPFGNVTTVGQASLYPYLFAGMEYDSSGLYHTQSRYYSPTFGRFLSADAGMPPNSFSYVGNDPVNAIDPSGMTAEFVSGATGMSPPPDGARGVADAQPESGGLGGAVLAQGCEPIPCAPLPIQSSPESGSWLADLVSFFVGLFGGGGSQPAFIPRGYRRVAHYPSLYFITDSQADLQQFTPDLHEKSDTIEILEGIGFAATIIFAPEVDVAALAVEGAVELGEVVAEGEGAALVDDALVTVSHFTNAAGAEAIGEGGMLRAGSFVTTSNLSGLSASEVESALEIDPGKGAFSTTFQTPASNLGPAFNGPFTSGGITQFQLRNPALAANFVPTGP
ncbi:MAG: RHS repeat-associated core domain-containing protein [Candidatus Binataceae bacterium]|nr:RHS repeat-associated core domain-containing protein [Candidatus Binataceae bacterium]